MSIIAQIKKFFRFKDPQVFQEAILSLDAEAEGPDQEKIEILKKMLPFFERTVTSVMTPRADIDWIDLNQPFPKVQKYVLKSSHNYFPLSADTTPTPTYVPAVLENMRKALSSEMTSQETMNAAIGTALPWMVGVIETYKKEKGTTYPDGLTLNFNPIGGIVRDTPHALDRNPAFEINPKSGEVTLKA